MMTRYGLNKEDVEKTLDFHDISEFSHNHSLQFWQGHLSFKNVLNVEHFLKDHCVILLNVDKVKFTKLLLRINFVTFFNRLDMFFIKSFRQNCISILEELKLWTLEKYLKKIRTFLNFFNISSWFFDLFSKRTVVFCNRFFKSDLTLLIQSILFVIYIC